jgi:hypothetical protein
MSATRFHAEATRRLLMQALAGAAMAEPIHEGACSA